MLRVEKKHEIELPLFAGENAQQFWIAEQVSASPLYHIQVLQTDERDPEVKLWNTYLATQADYAASLIVALPWETVRVSVLLPAWMTDSDEPVIAKCHAWWRCSHLQDEKKEYWLYETDLFELVGSAHSVRPEDLKKITLFWHSDSSKFCGIETS